MDRPLAASDDRRPSATEAWAELPRGHAPSGRPKRTTRLPRRPPPLPPAPALRQARAQRFLERFATAFLACLDPCDGQIRYANAGHNYPILRRSDGRIEELARGATPLGAFPGIVYEESRIGLEPGDVLVLYTDGVTETEDASGEQFGEEGLERLIHDCHDCSAETIVDRIREAVDQHGDGSAGDDMTLIVVRRLPN